ncbi:MAG: hypothetical protein F4Y30_04890 [Chloroflexi bacterium]|nr:hypothetical protein [Chloroflexota bacterium]
MLASARHPVASRLAKLLPELVALACICFVYTNGLSSLKTSPAYVGDDMETLNDIHPLNLSKTYDLLETVRIVAWQSMEHAPLYYVALNIWQGAAGYDLLTARLLSVYFAVLAVAAAWQVGRLSGSRELACGAAIALACSAFFLHYAHVTRMYTLNALLAAWLMWSYWRVAVARRRPPLWRWLSLFLATAIIIYVHYFGFLLIAAIGGYHLLYARKDRRWLAVSLVMVAGCLTFIGWLPIALRGFGRSRDALLAAHMNLGEALQAILSLPANGLWVLPVIAFAAALLFRRRLQRGEKFLLFIALAMLAEFLLLNEIVPILVDHRMRYTTILLLPFLCALPVGLRHLPGWRGLRWLFVTLAFASSFAWAGSEDLFRYTGLRHSQADRKTHVQEFIYAADRFPGSGHLILSLGERARWTENGHPLWYRAQLQQRGYADLAFIGYADGQLWVNNGNDRFSTLEGIVENALGAWVIHNPAAVDLRSLVYYRDWFSQHYRSCGDWLEKPKANIAFYLQRAIPCQLITDDQPFAIAYDNGALLGNALVEQTATELTVFLWWHNASKRPGNYTLQLIDTAGEALAETSAPIAADPLDISRLELTDLPAGDYALRLTVQDAETGAAQPGQLLSAGRRFESEVTLYNFSLDN